jgi:hypothetical protein
MDLSQAVFSFQAICPDNMARGANSFSDLRLGLCLRRLLFRLGRGLSTSEAEDLLRCNLVGLVCDPTALDSLAAILS